MDVAVLTAALTAGMLAAFNPCGFALLPGYLGLFLSDSAEQSAGGTVRRSLRVSASMTAGFIAVFTVIGLLISTLAWQITAYTPYVTLIVGPLLVALGIYLTTGRELKLRIPRLRGKVGASPVGMFMYGMTYATVSLSCTLPIFLVAVVGATRTASFGAGLLTIIVYGLGMGLVITALTFAVAMARDGFVSRSRSFVKYINRISGFLLILAGGYLTWYGFAEIQVLNGNADASLPDFGARAASAATSVIDQTNPFLLAAIALGVIAACAVGITALNRTRNVGSADDGDRVETGSARPTRTPSPERSDTTDSEIGTS
ncbi:MAG: cytochrome c biogenesis protein CcdA [Actinobacteria bacterium]|nr:cytochrome c biogenesis protein CcdA [Actinomycetota bacterium]